MTAFPTRFYADVCENKFQHTADNENPRCKFGKAFLDNGNAFFARKHCEGEVCTHNTEDNSAESCADNNAELAVTMLEMQGVHVERVVNGQQAVDRFQETLPGTYDLILMDLQMPVKGGLEAAAEIRSLSRDDAQEIPVIAMTANTLQEDREKALAAGMNAFIPKPFDVEQLYKSIEKFLH